MESLNPPLPDYLTPEVMEGLFSDDYIARVRTSRLIPPEKKLLAGGDLHVLACWHLRWATHILCPNAPVNECHALVQQFLAMAQNLDDPDPKPPQ
jgi:hypothetical protein